jgi:hypothetical protein
MQCRNLDSIGVFGPNLGAVSYSPAIGGSGGDDYGSALACPVGSALTGLQLRVGFVGFGTVVDQMGVVCTNFRSGHDHVSGLVGNRESGAGVTIMKCPASTVATGFKGRQGLLLDQIQLLCK